MKKLSKQLQKRITRALSGDVLGAVTKVKFNLEFYGGRGVAEVKVKRGSILLHILHFEISSSQTIELEKGTYRILLTGESPTSTDFTINKTTDPTTPKSFATRTFAGSYSLIIS